MQFSESVLRVVFALQWTTKHVSYHVHRTNWFLVLFSFWLSSVPDCFSLSLIAKHSHPVQAAQSSDSTFARHVSSFATKDQKHLEKSMWKMRCTQLTDSLLWNIEHLGLTFGNCPYIILRQISSVLPIESQLHRRTLDQRPFLQLS